MMRKQLTMISVLCTGALAASSALAATYDCGADAEFCAGTDLYSVEVGCYERSGDADPAFTGILDVTFPGWELDISYDDNAAGDEVPASKVCEAEGTINLDSEGSKTEYKCSEQSTGPKKEDHPKFDGDTLQVDFEIKLEEADSEECPPAV